MMGTCEFTKDRDIFANEQPYEVVGNLPPEQEEFRANTEYESCDIPVFDLRQEFDSLSLDVHGFEYLKRPDLDGFDIRSENGMRDYLRAVVRFLKEHFQTDDVLVYNYNVCGRSPLLFL